MKRDQVHEALKSLTDKGLLEQNPDGTYTPTALGRAAVEIEDAYDRIQNESGQ